MEDQVTVSPRVKARKGRSPQDSLPWALVTGASSGIGYELAQRAAARGYNLVLTARRKERLQELAGKIEATGREVVLIPTDLAKRSAPRKLVETINKLGLPIELLINNAGVAQHGAVMAMEPTHLEELIAVNARALTSLTRLLLGPMLERKKGRILNVASIAAFQPVPSLAVYAASKAFVLSFSEALSEELRGSGVSVTALCPGLTKTDMVEGISNGVPDYLMQSAGDVAGEGLAACLNGEVVRIPGALNQMAILWGQYQPRWLTRALGGIAGRMAITQDTTKQR